MHSIMRIHYYVVRVLACLAGICVGFLIVGIGAEAIMRSLELGLIKGIIDLAEYSLFLIAVLAAPWLLNCNEHIRVDVLISQFQGRTRERAELLANAIMLLVSLVILYCSVVVLVESWQLQEIVYRELVFPDWWLQWQVPLAMALISLELFQRVFFPHAAHAPAHAEAAAGSDTLVASATPAEGVR